MGVAREIQPGHVKALLVHAFGKKRQAARPAGHAHDGVVLRQGGAVGEGKGEGTGRDDHPLPEGYLQVQVASEKFLLKKSDAGAHGDYLLFGVLSSVYTPFGPGQTKGAKKAQRRSKTLRDGISPPGPFGRANTQSPPQKPGKSRKGRPRPHASAGNSHRRAVTVAEAKAVARVVETKMAG